MDHPSRVTSLVRYISRRGFIRPIFKTSELLYESTYDTSQDFLEMVKNYTYVDRVYAGKKYIPRESGEKIRVSNVLVHDLGSIRGIMESLGVYLPYCSNEDLDDIELSTLSWLLSECKWRDLPPHNHLETISILLSSGELESVMSQCGYTPSLRDKGNRGAALHSAIFGYQSNGNIVEDAVDESDSDQVELSEVVDSAVAEDLRVLTTFTFEEDCFGSDKIHATSYILSYYIWRVFPEYRRICPTNLVQLRCPGERSCSLEYACSNTSLARSAPIRGEAKLGEQPYRARCSGVLSQMACQEEVTSTLPHLLRKRFKDLCGGLLEFSPHISYKDVDFSYTIVRKLVIEVIEHALSYAETTTSNIFSAYSMRIGESSYLSGHIYTITDTDRIVRCAFTSYFFSLVVAQLLSKRDTIILPVGLELIGLTDLQLVEQYKLPYHLDWEDKRAFIVDNLSTMRPWWNVENISAQDATLSFGVLERTSIRLSQLVDMLLDSSTLFFIHTREIESHKKQIAPSLRRISEEYVEQLRDTIAILKEVKEVQHNLRLLCDNFLSYLEVMSDGHTDRLGRIVWKDVVEVDLNSKSSSYHVFGWIFMSCLRTLYSMQEHAQILSTMLASYNSLSTLGGNFRNNEAITGIYNSILEDSLSKCKSEELPTIRRVKVLAYIWSEGKTLKRSNRIYGGVDGRVSPDVLEDALEPECNYLELYRLTMEAKNAYVVIDQTAIPKRVALMRLLETSYTYILTTLSPSKEPGGLSDIREAYVKELRSPQLRSSCKDTLGVSERPWSLKEQGSLQLRSSCNVHECEPNRLCLFKEHSSPKAQRAFKEGSMQLRYRMLSLDEQLQLLIPFFLETSLAIANVVKDKKYSTLDPRERYIWLRLPEA